MPKTNLLDFDLKSLQDFLKELSEPSFRAVQLIKWIHQQGIFEFEKMTNLSKALREKLSLSCEVKAPNIVHEQVSRDGTIKWLMGLQDGNSVETVFIPERDRGTLCISSQVGCALNCSFCSTATTGYNRNLLTSEIIGQLWRARQRLQERGPSSFCASVTNVVMMGMGEPLLNMDAVLKALSLMREDNAYGLARRRVTVSTSGVLPGLARLASESEVALAVSLHAPDDELRNKLVPINKKYPLKELLKACKAYLVHRPKDKITMEYVMLSGVNDSIENAKALSRLLADIPCKINLIPFNPYPGAIYQCSSKEAIDAFQVKLMSAGYITVVRKTRGDDIAAACGQLVGEVQDRTSRNRRYRQNQGEQVIVVSGARYKRNQNATTVMLGADR